MNLNLYATTLPGFGRLAKEQFPGLFGTQKVKTINRLRNNDIVTFELDIDDLANTFRYSIAEDIFIELKRFAISGSKEDLKDIRAWVANFKFEPFLNLFPGQLNKRYPHSIRAVVQAKDEHWRKYRRIDLKKAIYQGLDANKRSKLKPKLEETDTEIWFQQIENEWLVGLRLSDIKMRQRDYREIEYPGALRPSAANALVFLSTPEASDVVLDPMCGTGTVLLERAHYSRYVELIGFDKNEVAVRATLENFGNKHKPWTVKRANALRLPLDDLSVNKIITNPPWGEQMEEEDEQMFAIELNRVLKSGGEIVMIRKAGHPLKEFKKLFKLKRKVINLEVLGQNVEIFVFTKI